MNKPPEINTLFILIPGIRSGIILILVILFVQTRLSGQEIAISAVQEPLSKVLLGVARDHGVQLSFDDNLLSAYSITVQRSFVSQEAAITYLLKDLPLEYEKVGEVYTIFKKHIPPAQRTYRVSGKLIDRGTGESLPYAHVMINNTGMVSDFNGNFSYVSSMDSLFEVTLSYLGYYIHDTLLYQGKNHVLGLTPSMVGLREVVIEGSAVERSGQAGDEAGVIRLNHQIAYRLPGNGDNSVFNFLRLQPGILAAGERSSEMVIWGSYSGHSQVLF
ncbi:MAG: carboxypeptidase-like regulatory domain-containing protein, partial [Bacteroidales bacterium]|nr:carboxypeptidase-like regulatory domain-containing protein [Bacteroidales bacterium]